MKVTYNDKAQELLAPLDSPVLHAGVVGLIMTPPVDITHFIQLLRNLLKYECIKILSTNGSYEEKSVIMISVEEPLPLIKILLEMPEVEKTEVLGDSDSVPVNTPLYLALQGEQGDRQEKSIVISFASALSNGGC